MRIGIDARAAVEERAGGGTVVRELLRVLATQDGEHEYVLFARRPWKEVPPAQRVSWQLLRMPDPWWNVRCGVLAHRHCDVFLSTNSYLTAWFTQIPTVVIVYDLVAFDDALAPQRRAKVIERATLPIAARRATALTAISQATADDLVRRFPVARGKTTVTPLAAASRFARAADAPVGEVLARHGLHRPYVL